MFRVLIVYVAPEARPLKDVELCHIIPSLLYCRLTPNGDVMIIVPVVKAQVGWVRVATGVAGGDGTASTVKTADETQVGFIVVLALIVYVVPAARPLKVVELCHVDPSLLYCRLAPNGDVTTMVPVVTAHVGCVTVANGVAGALGAVLTTKFAVETQVGFAVVLALIVYVAPAGKAAKVVELCQVVPLMLYCRFAPTGEVTTIVPVVTAQVGCVSVAAGAAGAFGMAFTTKFADETQVGLAVLLTLMVYVAPAGTAVKVAEVCHVVPFLLYCRLAPTGEVTTIVPVVTAQVGCVTVANGAAGGVGTALTTKLADETQVGFAVVLALTV